MRILLVEDNALIGDAARDQIVAEGWEVDWVADLKSAMKAVDLQSHDLILLDLHLPDGSGLDLLRRLHDEARPVPVIILSAYDQISDRIEGFHIGAIDYLVKPFNLSELIVRIRRTTASPDCSLRIGRFGPRAFRAMPLAHRHTDPHMSRSAE